MSGAQREGHGAVTTQVATGGRAPDEVLGRARAEDALAAPDFSAMWRCVDAETSPERESWRERLRHLSTPRRVGLTVFGALVVALLTLVIGGARTDLASQTIARYAVAMIGLVVLAAATFAVSLRGAHQRPLGPWGWAIVAASVVVPVLLAFVPWLWEPEPGAVPHAASDICLVLGGSTGVIAAAIAWVFQRSDTPVAMRVLAALGGGGIVAFAMLQLHCPAHDATHLLVGHAGVGLFLVVVAGVAMSLRGRRA